MDRLAHDEKLCNDILKSFLKEIPGYIHQLNKVIVGRDGLGTRRLAHTIKGSAGNVGAANISRLSREIETEAGKENWPAVDELFKETTAQHRELTMHLKERFGIGV
jgi:HPt (histidine-containing phosphotransfer) domain-containing protein